MLTLTTPLTALKGVGPRRAADLHHAGLVTVGDLLARFPLRYEDRSQFTNIADMRPGQPATVVGVVSHVALKLTRRRGFKLVEAVVQTESGLLRAVWLNQPFMMDVVRKGRRVVLFGDVELRPPAGYQLTNPQYELVDAEEHGIVHTGRIVPVYERVGDVTCRMQRTLVIEALQNLSAELPETLPAWVCDECHLPDRLTALREVHFPSPGTDAAALSSCRTPAQVRLILEEFFAYQLGLLWRRRAARAESKPVIPRVDDRIREAARAVLPFPLTTGQRQALKAIVGDMTAPAPMQRLLQGDVGSGKTVVALLAAVVAMENHLQVAFMAPTEVLAEQHAATLARAFVRAPYTTALLTGSTPNAERRRVLEGLLDGSIQLVTGTHALVQESVEFRSLGFVVVDEQHRFGVLQRAVLRRKGWNPDVLVMTATPIPRTLALTTYGDLDVSVMTDLPPGRSPITTIARPQTERDDVYTFVKAEVAAGRQAYVVFPLIEASEKLDVRAATEMADHLAMDVMPDVRMGLLHGRLRRDEKERVMRAFVQGDIDVLVSTTVIEVGIDVPNATVMVVEHAERFGLAQLHQLRGRVGRGAHASTCILLYQGPLGEAGDARLATLVASTDGFVIAEKDLELRGPGDFFGTRQSGAPSLRSGDLLRDRQLMEEARRVAERAINEPGAASLVDEIRQSWSARFGLADVG